MISLELEFSEQAKKLMSAANISEVDVVAFVKSKKYVVGGGDIVSFIEQQE
jgi:hypothetical protein